jgi:hypothetical protein
MYYDGQDLIDKDKRNNIMTYHVYAHVNMYI